MHIFCVISILFYLNNAITIEFVMFNFLLHVRYVLKYEQTLTLLETINFIKVPMYRSQTLVMIR